uniref:Integrase_H2C2 domain-containing protein n=1 Tax=Heligmosomoides polygyrus TaxID=6339 RepID=A0A183GTT2_HELPZ
LVQVALVIGVFCDRKIPERLKSKIYRAVVRPVAIDEDAALHGMDRIRNDVIRQMFGVAPIADKMRETRLRWYGHIDRELEVSRKRYRGRPKQRWSDTLHTDLKVAGVHPDLALDSERWRHGTRTADSAARKKKKKKCEACFQAKTARGFED